MNLSSEYRRFNIPKEKDSHHGLDAWAHRLVGKFYRSLFSASRFKRQAQEIHEMSMGLKDLSDQILRENLEASRKVFRMRRINTQYQFNLALSQVAETSSRILGMRPFVVQLMGVIAQYNGFAIEMLPGEGKTITAALAGVLAAWSGDPVHIVTSNDYLASRDAQSMAPLFENCRVSVSSVTSEMDQLERRKSYNCDVVYATSKELLADFLRDQAEHSRMSFESYLIKTLGFKNPKLQVMRGLYTVIIDEADSVLADEATTPLIISAAAKNELLMKATSKAHQIVARLQNDLHYRVNRKLHEIKITDAGSEIIDNLAAELPPIWKSKERREFLIEQAIAAKEFYHRDRHYVVTQDETVVIVDEKTGRLMKNRSWGAGLHQAIEAKEGVEMTDPTETHTRMSFQRFFRLYKKISGMSGTLQRLENEFWLIYKLPTIKIPKRIPTKYEVLPYKIAASKHEKWQLVSEEISQVRRDNRPILVGTRTIQESAELVSILRQNNIDCILLNALNHMEEASIVAAAGGAGVVTVATNMAGRGTDILLEDKVALSGGLHVISTQRHESLRVDLQLFGRAGRQGQPGTVREILSLDDIVMENLCPPQIRKLLSLILRFEVGQIVASTVYKYYQGYADRQASTIRAKILEKDFSLNDMLSFSK